MIDWYKPIDYLLDVSISKTDFNSHLWMTLSKFYLCYFVNFTFVNISVICTNATTVNHIANSKSRSGSLPETSGFIKRFSHYYFSEIRNQNKLGLVFSIIKTLIPVIYPSVSGWHVHYIVITSGVGGVMGQNNTGADRKKATPKTKLILLMIIDVQSVLCLLSIILLDFQHIFVIPCSKINTSTNDPKWWKHFLNLWTFFTLGSVKFLVHKRVW